MDDLADALDEMMAIVFRAMPARHGLSVTATSCLARLDRAGPLRLTALATAEGVRQPSMSQLVKRLSRQGFVTRVGDPADGRASLVAVTDRGREMLAERHRDRRARLVELLSTLPADDTATLQLALRVALPLVRAALTSETP